MCLFIRWWCWCFISSDLFKRHHSHFWVIYLPLTHLLMTFYLCVTNVFWVFAFLCVFVYFCFCVYHIHKNYTHTRRQVETRVWRSRLFINPLSLERRWPISIIRPWTCQPSQSSATSRNFLKNSNKKNPNESRKSPNIRMKNKGKNLTTNK